MSDRDREAIDPTLMPSPEAGESATVACPDISQETSDPALPDTTLPDAARSEGGTTIPPGTPLPRLEVGAIRRKLSPPENTPPMRRASTQNLAPHSGQLRSLPRQPVNRPVHRPRKSQPVQSRRIVRPPQPSRWGMCLKAGLTIASLTAAIGLIGGGIWLGTRLILHPNQVTWLNRWLPEWTRIPIDQAYPPQTIAEVQAEIRQVGLIPGDLIPLTPQQSAAHPTPVTAWLLPISSPSPCPQSRAATRASCDVLVELRVYQTVTDSPPANGEPCYRRMHQLMVAGPAESFVLASLLPPNSPPDAIPPGSNQPLPLTDLRRFEGILPGLWFSLSGERVHETQTLLYGQILHYHPDQFHLSLLAPWVSPANQLPTWQEVTGGGQPELVVNQTIDLEPKLVIYQLHPRNFLLSPWELTPLTLTPPALNDATYQQGIKLAQVGLWSPALQQLEPIKAKGAPWSDLAQAQWDLIKFHARITALQADQTWVSASEQVLTHLLDGRWEAALAIFDQSAAKRLEVATLLQTDPGRLWRRLETALAVTPDSVALQTWGALFMQAQRGYEGAIAWLQQQRPMDTTREALIRQRLDRLQAAEAAQALPSHFSQILGSVTPIAAPNPADWLRPDDVSNLDTTADHGWYRIQVLGFHDGQQWQQPPFPQLNLSPTTGGQQLWRLLGLNTDAQVQVVTWQADDAHPDPLDDRQQVTLTQVRAVRFENGVLELLAQGPALPASDPEMPTPPPFALTGTAARLLRPPPTVSLATLHRDDPQATERFFMALWRDLQQAGKVPADVNPNLADWLPWIGAWPVQTVPLTQREKPDRVLNLGPDELTLLKSLATRTPPEPSQPQPRRTVILSSAGHLIYSEFTATPNQRLTAIVHLSPQEPAYLLISDRGTSSPAAQAGYRLQHWSPQQQGFRSGDRSGGR